MRLFVGIWPPPDVLASLAALPRPEHPSVRWTPQEQWHVTLRFLGDVADEDGPVLLDSLGTLGPAGRPTCAYVGPATRRLDKGTLVVPVAGLDDLAHAVTTATSGLDRGTEARPFVGHLTLARGRGGRPIPSTLAGASVAASFGVAELALVCSRLGHDGPRYETLATIALPAGR